jgi:hypothetical protein
LEAPRPSLVGLVGNPPLVQGSDWSGGDGRVVMGRAAKGRAAMGQAGTGRAKDWLGKNSSVGDGSIRNGSVAKKVAADLPSFYWFFRDSKLTTPFEILVIRDSGTYLQKGFSLRKLEFSPPFQV